MLSMSDAIALALENNLDIAISRYNLHIADTDVLRTKAGYAAGCEHRRGARHSREAVWGAWRRNVRHWGRGRRNDGRRRAVPEAGTLGIVSSTLGIGSHGTSYDPIITGTLQLDRNNPAFYEFLFGRLSKHRNRELELPQGFHTRARLMSVTFDNTRFGPANPVPTVSPQLNSNFRLQLSQHLLQGFGFAEPAFYRDREEQSRDSPT